MTEQIMECPYWLRHVFSGCLHRSYMMIELDGVYPTWSTFPFSVRGHLRSRERKTVFVLHFSATCQTIRYSSIVYSSTYIFTQKWMKLWTKNKKKRFLDLFDRDFATHFDRWHWTGNMKSYPKYPLPFLEVTKAV